MKLISISITITAICLLFLVSCGDTKEANNVDEKSQEQPHTEREHFLSEYNWLLGEWIIHEGESGLHEDWVKNDDNTFSGKTYFIQTESEDTVLLETIHLRKKEDGIYFCPKVVDQNDEEEVEFKLVTDSPDSLIFVNPDHDFPTLIGYVHHGDDLFAWIEGKDEHMNEKRVNYHYELLK